ncbi:MULTISPECIES: 2,3-bisphosphoglycerate-independent phosphoglycerate mutase [Cyanophyceae]|uniref:2,3-bisphosphoglycerate-independent phosphoglycerate mutase n=1 Tax=Cyanophyceae TaxID=3028117 RepID=UPI001688CC6E|nr:MULTISPECIES: 2,3-bisphosphoglycerate-independent phosphoglycerate mutase [Cyanophyceae]MBD1914513.1 2,3-bisphosphoglycerate-independent phosphoglycerate mutase [Phormidium sp. FACHB-77]MBD2031086.1 2,3-bisphosphoglycerate-independent phosphoglycerate mutase [Phormidium sp. FACHB-322]MBD2052081.1 2,3-bisphosphoglycerate-independent phosphoglycerate mutase [Leptolyngbya sp. FACHB-60]
MSQASIPPMVLIILDGWGYRENTDGNAIAAAKTPVMDSLWAAYPHTLIRTSGKDVGLPDGQMGNSEVGHLNIGAGRIVPQELVRISDAVEDGTLQENEALLEVCQAVRYRNSKLHLVGLCSEGGVHSHLSHLFGLLEMAKAQDIHEVCVHVITDGRDTKPTEAQVAVQKIQDYVDQLGLGRLVTLSGRYYAMDRDNRWDRVEKAYRVMTDPGEGSGKTAMEALLESYDQEINDEFVEPVRLAPGAIAPEDGVIFFNFRPDRARQLTQALVDPNFKGFERELIAPPNFVTMTQYDPEMPVKVAFQPQNLSNILGEVVANNGLKQFRTSETEKYAHVTYFFNGGLEEPLKGEDRELVSSPMVATYDKAPAMSAEAVTNTALAAIKKGIYSLVVINYANPDMVGHTGKMDSTITALQAVDYELGRLIGGIGKAGGTAIIIADHGNAELMWDENHKPWTAHTTNPVPFILVEGEKLKVPAYGGDVNLREDGRLSDIAPTILQILGLPQPQEMTGRSMFLPADMEIRNNRTPVKLSL